MDGSPEGNPSSCDETLWAAVSGDLSKRQMRALERALERDPERCEIAREIRATQDCIPLYELPEPSTDLGERILSSWRAEARQAGGEERKLVPTPPALPWYRRSVSVSLPLAALTLLALSLGLAAIVLLAGRSGAPAGHPSRSVAKGPRAAAQPESPKPPGAPILRPANRMVLGAMGSAAGLFANEFEEGFDDLGDALPEALPDAPPDDGAEGEPDAAGGGG